MLSTSMLVNSPIPSKWKGLVGNLEQEQMTVKHIKMAIYTSFSWERKFHREQLVIKFQNRKEPPNRKSSAT